MIRPIDTLGLLQELAVASIGNRVQQIKNLYCTIKLVLFIKKAMHNNAETPCIPPEPLGNKWIDT